ncbi:MAG: 2-isopropylmalate synthase [Myxococcales bacterium]|nr:2-isopropylmalate synthase [Myxococcales bacterium]
MLTRPSEKYAPLPGLELPDRRWPSRRLEKAPIWLSTDLRDGNQALPEPMGVEAKLELWKTLVHIGFKEIEVGFPSASQVDFDFVRRLIEEGHIPEDVTVQVLTPAREELIERTFLSLEGASRAIVHMYNATAPHFRETVFGLTKDEVVELAAYHAKLIRTQANARPDTDWRFEYSPEAFSQTELPFARKISDEVCAAFASTPERPMILNLPATVEVSTPNVFADQVEWMDRHLERRSAICISVHTHNDRGTGVAAAELAQMAGAERVEGCLFGNGERTGNTCLVTLALNLYTHGMDPQLDFSSMDAIRQVTEKVTKLPVHPRHPYAGDLVYTAFSGTHQDAIRKGMAARHTRDKWDVPYLPLDPADVGRNYRAMVRVNGQSGKGGIAFILEEEYDVHLPRPMQEELRDAFQVMVDREGGEFDASQLYTLTRRLFAPPDGRDQLVAHQLMVDPQDPQRVEAMVEIERGGSRLVMQGSGDTPLSAFAQALGMTILQSHEHMARSPRELGTRDDESSMDGRAMVSVAVEGDENQPVWGFGEDHNIVRASLLALLAAGNRNASREGGTSSSAGSHLVSDIQPDR